MRALALTLLFYMGVMNAQPVFRLAGSFGTNNMSAKCEKSCCKNHSHQSSAPAKQIPDDCCAKATCNPFMCCCTGYNITQTESADIYDLPRSTYQASANSYILSGIRSGYFQPPEIG